MENTFPSGPENRGLTRYSDRRIVICVCILSVLFLLDVLTTHIILSGGGIEYNLFMAGIVQNPLVHIIVKTLLLLLVVLVAKNAETTVKGSGLILFYLIILWYTICLGNNLGSILRIGLFP